jgi:hypothetical protein
MVDQEIFERGTFASKLGKAILVLEIDDQLRNREHGRRLMAYICRVEINAWMQSK